MSDDKSEDFLSRWSRRKREVAATEKVAAPQETPPQSRAVPATQPNQPAQTAQPEFDPATLPPLDSITALSDIRDFLRAGVPPELTRAALRRAWSADPAIRDFVGLAENAWDFTDPNAMPGFGPLEATDDIRQMVAQIMSRVSESGDLLPPRTTDIARSSPETPHEQTSASPVSASSTEALPASTESHPPVEKEPRPPVEKERDIALQQEKHDPDTGSKEPPRRVHGGALPR